MHIIVYLLCMEPQDTAPQWIWGSAKILKDLTVQEMLSAYFILFNCCGESLWHQILGDLSHVT